MRIGWKSGGLASRIFERLANHCCIFPTLYLQITFLFGNESDYNERQKSAGMWVLAALLCSFFGEEPIFFLTKGVLVVHDILLQASFNSGGFLLHIMTQFLLNAHWNQSACSDVHLRPNPVPWDGSQCRR